MAKKDFSFRGKTLEEVQKLSHEEFLGLITARARRSLKRTQSQLPQHKRLLRKIDAGKNNIETHARDMVIVPKMIGKTIKIYNGKEFFAVLIMPEMVGHVLGEFALTRKKIAHNAPGIGATKSSSNVSVK